MIPAPVRSDLHLHSRHSVRAPEWFFRRAGLQDSYSEPRALYEQLKVRGMNFFTLTDHNSIQGCLEIADRPGVFISEQITASFPEDRTAAHLLVWGINEAQHGDMQALRENIYDLQDYLARQNIAHAVAHPLYKTNGRLDFAHIEKLLLLFKHFEGINGLRDALLGDVTRFILKGLTPHKIDEMANRHRLAPTHFEPWKKVLIAGSDDHGGMNPASAYTSTPACATPAEFLCHIRESRCEIHGAGGSPLTLSHGLYNNLRCFIGEKVAGAESSSFVGKAFSRFMEGEDPTEFSWADKIGFIAQGIATGKIFELAKPAHVSVWRQFAAHFSQTDVKGLLIDQTAGIVEPERRAFVIANFFVNQLAFRFFTRFVKQAASGSLIAALQEVSVMLPIVATLAPYLYAFRSQAPDRGWLADVSRRFAGELAPALKNRKRAWFTDTLEDVNGVANTIRKLTAAVVAEGNELVVVTSRSSIQISDIPIKNFPPIGEFELPEYELQKLSFPPVLQMLDYIHREGFTELIISTPGPVGITALIAARILGIRTSGIYHTDFPQYVRILTDDSALETLTWSYMKFFYDQLDLIYVNSESYRHAWIERGIAPDKFRILPRGLDTTLFHPSRRDPGFWEKYGIAPGSPVLLYVGRVSKEKDLDLIASMWSRLRKGETREFSPSLAIVGDGPYLKELQELLPDATFTGYLAGLDLARAFASADLFLFPSTTDTFGNVVLEALASGLPNVVSDQGGPRDLITEGKTGYVTRARDVAGFTAAVQRLIDDPALRKTMSLEAFDAVQQRDWSEAGRAFWAMPAE
ncbi:MAG: rfaG [Chthoniobacteraceae bacterium]|nr:rfaG [Chthoniobacteraceae bacterium]